MLCWKLPVSGLHRSNKGNVMAYLSETRFFSPESVQRELAVELYEAVKDLPIVSPHGHVDPKLLADEDISFGTPTEMLIIPDHYIFRMLYSQGISLESLGVPRRDGGAVETDHRKIWQLFADISTTSGGHRLGYGWLMNSVSSLILRTSSTAKMPSRSMISLRKNWPCQNSAHGHCLSALILRCSAPPTRQTHL